MNVTTLICFILLFLFGLGMFFLKGDDKAEDDSRVSLIEAAALALPREEGEETLRLCRKALRFLIQNMPESDLNTITPEFLAELTTTRVKRRLTRWPHVPWDIFIEYTLPYAVLSEPRDASLEFFDKVTSYVSSLIHPSMTLSQAAILLNHKAYDYTFPRIRFEPAPPNQVNSYSPVQVVHAKSASCTGESVFLVTALRLAGIPARIVGVPHWSLNEKLCPKKDSSPNCGNHNWVEVYTELNEWAFLDENKRTGLNTAFFFPKQTDQLTGDKMHSIYAATWRIDSTIRFPLVFDPENNQVSAITRTTWYQTLPSPKYLRKNIEYDDDVHSFPA